MQATTDTAQTSATALRRHLELLGKALGRNITAERSSLVSRLTRAEATPQEQESSQTSETSGANDEGAQHPQPPRETARHKPALSALDRLRAHARQPHRGQHQAQQLGGQNSADPANSGEVNHLDAQPGQPGATSMPAATAVSAIERLRELSRVMAPKRLERREDDRLGEPLVGGGPRPPLNYPSAEHWPDDRRPPGSRYSAQEWAQAAAGSEGASDSASTLEQKEAEYAVVEVLGAHGSVLMRLPRAFRFKHYERQGKHVVERDSVRYTAGADPQRDAAGILFGQAFDGCMIVLPDARPDFPGAIEPRKHRHGKHEFWVIRPRHHYLDAMSNESFFCNARWVAQDSDPELEVAPASDRDGDADTQSDHCERPS